MNRRFFLKSSAAAACAAGLPIIPMSNALAAQAASAQELAGAGWRTYEITARINVQAPAGGTRAWLPLPLAVDTDYQRTLGIEFTAPGAHVEIAVDPIYNARMLVAQWDGKTGQASADAGAEVVMRIATRDRNAPAAVQESARSLRLWLEPTELLPTDGIVRATAKKITQGARTEMQKARAIYDWVVDNTFRDPKVRGCGTGDVKYMLETGNLGGKCADLNAVFVALARAAGIPARDVYGIRADDSARGYKSLGKSGDLSRAQHCRAEFHVAGIGWVPVDPADVRKVILEEGGGLKADDARVAAIRDYLFGNWEMNWVAYNYAHDLKLPGSKGAPVPYLMYPNAETADGRLDQLDPENFRYRISGRRVEA